MSEESLKEEIKNLSLDEVRAKYAYYNERYSKNYASLRICTQRLIELGDEAYYTTLGHFYHHGYGVEQNYQTAREMYIKAEAYTKSHPDAESEEHEQARKMYLNNHAYLYMKGTGVPRDIDKAIAMLEEASAAGNFRAPNNLGDIYYLDEYKPYTDYTKARKYYELAYERGHIDGLMHLIHMCYEGLGGPVDKYRAEVLSEEAHAHNITVTDTHYKKIYMDCLIERVSKTRSDTSVTAYVIKYLQEENAILKAENEELHRHIEASPDGELYLEARKDWPKKYVTM